MFVDIQLKSIQVFENTIINKPIEGADFLFEYAPKIDHQKNLTEFIIKVTFWLGCSQNRHIKHSTKTVYTINGIHFDKNILSDPRQLTMFCELTQIAMSHARVNFVRENGDITEGIPLMMWMQQLIVGVREQLLRHLN